MVKRRELEQALTHLLEEMGSVHTFDSIKEIIYNEEGQADLAEVIALFDTGQHAPEIDKILELINDAWNYFPHKIIGGISPAEMLLKYRK